MLSQMCSCDQLSRQNGLRGNSTFPRYIFGCGTSIYYLHTLVNKPENPTVPLAHADEMATISDMNYHCYTVSGRARE